MDAREKLIKQAISHFWYGVSHDIFSEPVTTYAKLAIDALEKESGVMVQEWISVKDRLPEEGEYVLCVLKGSNYGGKIQVCKFVPADKFKDKPYFEHFRNGFPSVTHWMPLPQPPKENDNG